MKNKEEMINWMRDNEIDFDSISQDRETHGWRFVWGHYEPFLENTKLKRQGLVGTSIYQSDLE